MKAFIAYCWIERRKTEAETSCGNYVAKKKDRDHNGAGRKPKHRYCKKVTKNGILRIDGSVTSTSLYGVTNSKHEVK